MELGLFVQSWCEANGKELWGWFGDKNSKLSLDFRGVSGEDMMAAQVGGLNRRRHGGMMGTFIAC